MLGLEGLYDDTDGFDNDVSQYEHDWPSCAGKDASDRQGLSADFPTFPWIASLFGDSGGAPYSTHQTDAPEHLPIQIETLQDTRLDEISGRLRLRAWSGEAEGICWWSRGLQHTLQVRGRFFQHAFFCAAFCLAMLGRPQLLARLFRCAVFLALFCFCVSASSLHVSHPGPAAPRSPQRKNPGLQSPSVEGSPDLSSPTQNRPTVLQNYNTTR